MPYSSVATIRAWCRDITPAKLSDAVITNCIFYGDRWVKIALSKWPSLLVDLPGTEDYVRALAESATCEIVYRQAYSEEGEAEENKDRIMWQRERDALLQQFRSGEIVASTGPGVQVMESNASRANRVPVFGYGKWSERVIGSLPQPESSAYVEVREDV